MTALNTPPSYRVLHGIVLMSAAMLIIPFADAVAKHLSAEHSPLWISWARYVAATAIIVPIAIVRRGRNAVPRSGLGPHILRTIFLMTAMTLYFVAIASVPLATANSAFFIGPIAASVLAVVILGERMTMRRTLALGCGVIGALLIVRPGGAVEPGVLLALGAGLAFACYMIATRQASQSSDPLATLTFQCALGMVILTPQAIWTWSVPTGEALLFVVLMGCLSLLSHGLSITAFGHAEASVLAPLVYLEIVGSVGAGYLIFGHWPGTHVWLGAAVIAAGGLLLVRRGA